MTVSEHMKESSGSTTHGGMLPRVTAPIMSSQTLLRFRWPSKKHLTPTHCQTPHCGARLIVSDTPTADQRVTDVVCMLCTRIACELISDHAPRQMTAAEFRALPTPYGRTGRPPSTGGTIAARLVKLLDGRNPMAAWEIAEQLNISVEQARNGAYDARKHGHRVEFRDGAYALVQS